MNIQPGLSYLKFFFCLRIKFCNHDNVQNENWNRFFCLSEFLSMQNNKQGWKTFSLEMQICKFAYYVLTNLLVHGFTLKVLCWIIRRKKEGKRETFQFFFSKKCSTILDQKNRIRASVFYQFCQIKKINMTSKQFTSMID